MIIIQILLIRAYPTFSPALIHNEGFYTLPSATCGGGEREQLEIHQK